jgi:biopolymer transport protein ExbB
MKKRALAIILLVLAMTFTLGLFAQDEAEVNVNDDTAQVEAADMEQGTETATEEAGEVDTKVDEPVEMSSLESIARNLVGSGLVDIFIQGGFAMWPMLALLIWAMGVIIWKLISLSYASANIKEILGQVIPMIEEKKFKEASEYCGNQRGPVATIIHVGLLKANKGVDAVEKTIDNAAALEMAYLEKGFNPLGTTITLAPMFGFFGTLVGMIQAFDAIAAAGEVDPTIVADGIKVALITSAGGLAIAIPVQFFNNIFQTWCDKLIIDMQLASEKVVEALVEVKGE